MQQTINGVNVKYLGMSTEIYETVKDEFIDRYYNESKRGNAVILYELNTENEIQRCYFIYNGLEIEIHGRIFVTFEVLHDYIVKRFDSLLHIAGEL